MRPVVHIIKTEIGGIANWGDFFAEHVLFATVANSLKSEISLLF
jgi:hypothetical protein